MTDGRDAYLRAIRETLGDSVRHRPGRYKNNRIAQGRRAIERRHYPLRGLGGFAEQRQYFRAATRRGEHVPFTARRRLSQDRWAAVMAALAAA